MKVLLDIKDGKVSFVLELLNSLSFVKVKPLSDEKAELMSNIKEAVEELNLIKQGKLKGIPAKDLLNEL
jgi:hypothetical protein